MGRGEWRCEEGGWGEGNGGVKREGGKRVERDRRNGVLFVDLVG